jgi:AraC-like DNA-binding protein
MLFEKAVLKTPFTRPVRMPNEACFLYILDGGNLSSSEKGQMVANKRDAVLMKCGNYFGEFLGGEKSQKYEAVAVHFYPEVLNKVYGNEIPDFLKNKKKTVSGIGMTKVKADEILRRFVDSMLFYFENPQLVTDELLVLKVKELFLILSQTQNAPAVIEILSNLFSPTTYGFKEIIESHLYSNITIEALATVTNLSVSSFKREFRKVYDDTPANYLKNKKIDKAKRMLQVSDQNISGIAYDCGFVSLAHFSKSFKEKFGLTPSQFKLNQKNKLLS